MSSRRSGADPSLAGWDGFGLAVQAYQKRALPLIDWLADLARAASAGADGAPGQGRLLGQRDQAQPGARPRRLSGLHPQGRDRRLLPRLRQAPARRRATPSIRSSPPTTPIPSPRCWSSPATAATSSSSACTAWARRSTSRWWRAEQARPALPRLCAGRQPRGSAGLSRAPPAGERRQHLLRQPHRRREGADRRDHRRSGRAACAALPRKPHPRIPLPRRSLRRRAAQLRTASI